MSRAVFYVEAYRGNVQLLGNLSGQCALIGTASPERSPAWREILRRDTPDAWKGADRWRLVDDAGRVLAEHRVGGGMP